ncbi:lipopolysaccharide biosynthesis protein [Micrococcus luteus]|uniref:lipopolysaccharide biosynthesis protein n=1 Tax=Micrococcus luteus TaxID=1270 RepID=UPI0030173C92
MSPSRPARAGLQSLGGTGIQIVIQLTSLVVLARLLEPADFGVYAMAITVIGFTALFKDMGLSAAAVQAKELSTQARANLWWLNTGVGALLTVAALMAAPLAAAFFDEPDVALAITLMSPTLVLAGMSVQYSASLMRQMRFGVLAVTDVAGSLLGLAVSVLIAANGGGVWAMAVPQVVAGLITLIGVAAAARWLPRLPTRGHGTRALFRFGAALFGAQVLTYVHRNFDVLLLGRLHGSAWTGLFNRGAQMTRMPIGMIAGPFGRVSLAALAPYQDDVAALTRLAARGQVMLALPILIVAGGLIATAEPLVALILGPGWEGAVPFVRFLAASEALALMASVGGWLITARGRGDRLIRLGLLSTVVKLTCISVGTFWGPHGIVAGTLAAQTLLWPLSLTLASRMADVPTRALLARSYLLTGVVGGATVIATLITHTALGTVHDVLAVVAGAGTLLIGLGLAALVFAPFRQDVITFVSTVRRGIR